METDEALELITKFVNNYQGVKEHAELLKALEALKEAAENEKFLHALEAAGVDNWEGYSMAYEFLEDEDF